MFYDNKINRQVGQSIVRKVGMSKYSQTGRSKYLLIGPRRPFLKTNFNYC